MLEKYRVNLAALRFGAGLKGKVTDGWLAGYAFYLNFLILIYTIYWSRTKEK